MTSTGLPDGGIQRFHSFEEANGHFEELAGQARAAGGQLQEESYWRQQFGSSGSTVRLALDDIGLLPCDAACGAG